jgi:methionyl-tRNA formyltransferase
MMNFSMLLVNNNRSKAYLQNLTKSGFIPRKIVVLNDDNTTLVEHTENDRIMSSNTSQKFIRTLNDLNIEFDEKEHILKTIDKYKIDFSVVDSLNINSSDVLNEVKKIDEDCIVYSGPGGAILKKEILSLDKKIIHVHPGCLPKFKGSTTVYYSMYYNSTVGCSVIIFEEGIDEGPILYQNSYKITEKNIDFDYTLDPLIRAKALIEFFKIGNFNPCKQKEYVDSSTFYVIHPLLKHMSILKHNHNKEALK